MKITKSKIKQIIKEELTDEDIRFLVNGLKPIFTAVEKNQKEIDKIKDNVHNLNKDFRWLNGDLQSLEGSVMTINDKLSIKQPSRFAGPDVVRGASASGEKTNPRGMPTNEEIRSMVEEELEKELVYVKEKKLTKPEKKEKEKIVKGMKKNKDDFEKRYPGRGEEVMYATATKMAKKRK